MSCPRQFLNLHSCSLPFSASLSASFRLFSKSHEQANDCPIMSSWNIHPIPFSYCLFFICRLTAKFIFLLHIILHVSLIIKVGRVHYRIFAPNCIGKNIIISPLIWGFPCIYLCLTFNSWHCTECFCVPGSPWSSEGLTHISPRKSGSRHKLLNQLFMHLMYTKIKII